MMHLPRLMTMRASWLLPVVAVALLAACGGGGGGGPTGSAGRLTDPGTAPTATPVESPRVYVFDGDRVLSPSGSSVEVSPTPGPEVYVVQEGDTCSAIADLYSITLDELLGANPFIDSDCANLNVGDNVRIPETLVTPTPPAGTDPDDDDGDDDDGGDDDGGGDGDTYTVQDGDICGSIADQFGVSVDALIAANGLDANCTDLTIGQVLVIPAQ